MEAIKFFFSCHCYTSVFTLFCSFVFCCSIMFSFAFSFIYVINQKKTTYKKNNRERRTTFETNLLNEKRKMETFRLRETKEFLSIDELKEKCETSSNFMRTLEVN